MLVERVSGCRFETDLVTGLYVNSCGVPDWLLQFREWKGKVDVTWGFIH